MNKKFLYTLFFSLVVLQPAVYAQSKAWKKGIVTEEFIFDKASFLSSHAATIAETPKGLIAAWFGGTKERNPDVEIWVSRRVNNKWTKPVSVANGIQNDTLRYPTWNPVLYQVPGGELLLFYKIGPSPSTWKGWMITSKDNGITWSAAKALPEGYIGPVKNKPVLVAKNKLLSPTSTEGNGWKIHFEVTNDNGKTWRKIGPINDGKTFNAIQPSILMYKDGRLQILARSRHRAILESWSSDKGETWSPLAKTSLPNNNSGTDAVTLKDGRQLLVYNHVLPPGVEKKDDGTHLNNPVSKNGRPLNAYDHILAPGLEIKGARTPLNVSVSKDGKTWYAALILEDSPISQYSYPSVIQSKDGMVHFIYTWRREKIKYVKVDPSKLLMIPIKNGEWPKMKGYTAPKVDSTNTD